MAANFASPTLGGSIGARDSADATHKLWRTTKTAIVAAARKDPRRSCATVLIGATPGKQILGLKIIRTDTTPLGWIRAIVRFVGYFISAIAFFLGFLWVFVDGRRQGWHDKLADTFVVYSWDVTKLEAAPIESHL